jgi:hypothetical protein
MNHWVTTGHHMSTTPQDLCLSIYAPQSLPSQSDRISQPDRNSQSYAAGRIHHLRLSVGIEAHEARLDSVIQRDDGSGVSVRRRSSANADRPPSFSHAD